ncbi:MAG: Y-family DNA polymerase [Bacteroidales bacterium]|jgi:DNA polymerase V
MYGLCDCNNFFVSCERVFNPSLNGKPVLVLSSNDGCVIARSNEAKELGIKMGQPFFEIRELVEKNRVNLFSTNFSLYNDFSLRVMEVLRKYVPAIEVYSIDEAFFDLKGVDISILESFGKEIAAAVKKNIGIPVSIGIAPTKTLAKIASKLAKKYPKLEGCCIMYRFEDVEKVLKKIPVEDVWGIGRKLTKKLYSEGIKTAYDYTQLSSDWVKREMNVMGLRTWQELRGEACIGIEEMPSDKQQIMVSRSFAKEIDNFDDMHAAISIFISLAAEKLRKQKCCAGELNIFIFTNYYRKDKPQNYKIQFVRLDFPTDSTFELIEQGMKALGKIYSNKYTYKRAGIILTGIIKKNCIQGTLFDTTDRSKHSELMNVMDKINSDLGKGSVSVASQGLSPVRITNKHLSPCYTTRWEEILRIKV